MYQHFRRARGGGTSNQFAYFVKKLKLFGAACLLACANALRYFAVSSNNRTWDCDDDPAASKQAGRQCEIKPDLFRSRGARRKFSAHHRRCRRRRRPTWQLRAKFAGTQNNTKNYF